MKKILLGMLLSVLTLVLVTSCEKDMDSNPTFHENTTGFVLNMPANAANNVLDLLTTDQLTFTTSQPDYGGIPLSTNYDVEISFEDFSAEEPVYKVVASSTSATIKVSGSRLNDAVITMFQDANEGVTYPSNEVKDLYVRLHANVNGMELGSCYSNVIKIQVIATYQAPSITLPEDIYVCASSIGTAWTTWRPMALINGMAGNFFTIVYLPNDAEFKWGTYPQQWLGHADFKTIDDQAGADVSDNGGNVKVKNGGWYTLYIKGKINGEAIDYTLTFYPAQLLVTGDANGGFTPGTPSAPMIAPADNTGQWISAEFVSGGELRAYAQVGDFDWWKTEFTLLEGKVFWRENANIASNWNTDMGSEYSVNAGAGQKLYLTVGATEDGVDTGEVK